jgi:pilus assembly protein CpaC
MNHWTPEQRPLWKDILYSTLVIAVIVFVFLLSTAESATEEKPKPRSKYQRSKLTRDESEGEADKRRLLLTTGEDKAVDLDFEANAGANGITIGNPQLVATTLVKAGDRRQIVFKPLKAGETTVTVRDLDGTIQLIFRVRVTGSNLLTIKGQLRDLLRDIEGIDERIVGTKIVVEGEVLVPQDYGKLVTIIQDSSYANVIINLTTLSPLAMQFLAKRIQEDINSFAPNVKTRVVNGIIFLEGTVENPDLAKKALTIANYYLPELRPGNILERAKDPEPQRPLTARPLVQSFIIVQAPPAKKQDKLIRVTVHFVELSKDYNKLFGFKWQPGFTADPTIQIGTGATGSVTTGAGTTATSQGGFSFSATISSLFPKLQSAQQAGYARILKTGTMVVRNGQPAKLVEQTEFPFSQQGPNGTITAARSQVGLSIAATPTILGNTDDIQMDLDMTQSNVVGTPPVTGQNQAPVVATHQVNTKLFVKSTESAAVAGVTSADVGTDFNKGDPKPGAFDGNTDPLFTLLRSKAYRKRKSQFVIFVTPQIIENAHDGTEDLKRNFRVKVN